MSRTMSPAHMMAVAAGAAMTLVASAPLAPASAQVLWDWGGSQSIGGSGREVVRFPAGRPGEIIVSFSDRRLYHVTRPGEAVAYPIAIPREQSRWQGVTSVSMKRENPSWTPTATMRAENPRLPNWVPGGHPLNPLGTHALYLGSSAYRIHGTDAPWTIGSAVSKGCIRMYNRDVQDLYPRVPVGAKVTVTWQRYLGTGGSEERVAGSSSAPRPSVGMSGVQSGTGVVFEKRRTTETQRSQYRRPQANRARGEQVSEAPAVDAPATTATSWLD